MKRNLAVLMLFVFGTADAQWQERSEWGRIFESAEVEGTIAVLDQYRFLLRRARPDPIA